jgi:hypothetical protein
VDHDEELIRKIGELSRPACDQQAAQETSRSREAETSPRAKRAWTGPPIPAFSALTRLAPKQDGKPTVLGPYSPIYGGSVPTIRATRARAARRSALVPTAGHVTASTAATLAEPSGARRRRELMRGTAISE